tara:strand:- start:107 stop:2260 length:2154 start_codon:yes stop_codon:yes gene_type:complete
MAKKNINFEVYERQDPSSQVDWSKAAADITKTFTDIRDDRKERKDEINQQFLDTQDVLNDLGEYENQTMQEFVMNTGNDAANKLYDFNNLVKRGLAKPADQSMFTHNLKTDMTLLKKNATNFDNAFKAYSERTQLGENAAAEEFWAGQIEGFANINNLRGEANSETGRIGLVRFDEEGNPVKDESMTVQRLTVLMNQRIDKFDLPKQLAEATAGIGKLVSEQESRAGRNYAKLTKTEQTALTKKYIEDHKDDKTFQDFLGARVSLFLGSDQQIADFMVRNVAGPNGEAAGTYYKNGTKDEFDAWEKENPGVKAVKTPELPAGKGTPEGTEFRKWLRETHSEYATDNQIDPEGSNDFIQAAYNEYGQEYAKDFLDIETTTTKGVNPYIVQEIAGDNLAKANVTDEQREIAGKVALENITNSQDFSVTKEFKVTAQNAPIDRSSINDNKEQKKTNKVTIGYFKSLNKIMDGSSSDFIAARRDLIAQYNKENPDNKLKDIIRDPSTGNLELVYDNEIITVNGQEEIDGEVVDRSKESMSRELISMITPLSGNSYDEYHKIFTENQGGFEDLGGRSDEVEKINTFNPYDTLDIRNTKFTEAGNLVNTMEARKAKIEERADLTNDSQREAALYVAYKDDLTGFVRLIDKRIQVTSNNDGSYIIKAPGESPHKVTIPDAGINTDVTIPLEDYLNNFIRKYNAAKGKSANPGGEVEVEVDYENL